MAVCTKCGSDVNAEWVACPSCGNSLIEETSIQPAVLEAQNTGEKGKTPEIMSLFGSNAPVILIVVALLAVSFIYVLSSEEGYTLEYSHADAYILISEITVDNGEDNRMFEVDVYYDERDRYEYRTGEECDALEYYDFARTYYLDEICVFYFVDPFVEEASFGACVTYVSSERQYDISSSADNAGSCVKARGVIGNPSIEPSNGLSEQCTYKGQLVDDDLSIAKYVTFSGLDDGDSYSYNAELIFTLNFVLTYECL